MKRHARAVAGRAAGVAVVLAGMLVAALGTRAGAGETDPGFRFTRVVSATPGWARLELPGDVLDACRPALPDLRLFAADGREVPYAFDAPSIAAPEELALRDVETETGQETRALLDRGAHPSLADGADIVVSGDDFLKPLIVEASEDRATWREIARGSIFATPRARMTALRFAPNDRRWWRLRFDDRLGAPVAPRAVVVHAKTPAPALRAVTLGVERVATGPAGSGKSVYTLELPSANLSIARLHLLATDAAFVREVEVSERVLYRGEVSRRAVAGGTVLRAPGGKESLDVAVGTLAGRALEIVIDDGASPPLALSQVTLDLEPRALVFLAPATPVRLAYGSVRAAPARYDLTAALALGTPERFAAATLDAPVDRGASGVLAAPRGAPLDRAAWHERRRIALPPGDRGGVAYLALDGVELASPDEVRVVDAAGLQVPFVPEHAALRARSEARAAVAQRGTTTVVTLGELGARSSLVAVVLQSPRPDYFTRPVTAVEAIRDARGVTGWRSLGAATWERKPGAPGVPFALAVAAPSQPEIEVRVENGDNAPIEIGPVALERRVPRIDFEYAAGDRLELLTGNGAASAPRYDLAMLEDTLFASTAVAATLGPPLAATDQGAGQGDTPRWFWASLVLSGLLVAAVLVRTLARPAA